MRPRCLIVKPLEAELETNMTITTNRRLYTVVLKSSEHTYMPLGRLALSARCGAELAETDAATKKKRRGGRVHHGDARSAQLQLHDLGLPGAVAAFACLRRWLKDLSANEPRHAELRGARDLRHGG